MKRKESKKKLHVPAHVMRFLKQMDPIFGLGHYDRQISIRDDDKVNGDGLSVAASVDIQQDYQRVLVSLYPCFLKEGRNEQRKYLLHEFCHYFTADLLDCADNLRAGKLVTAETVRAASEKATSQVANLLESFLLKQQDSACAEYRSFTRVNKPKKRRKR